MSWLIKAYTHVCMIRTFHIPLSYSVNFIHVLETSFSRSPPKTLIWKLSDIMSLHNYTETRRSCFELYEGFQILCHYIIMLKLEGLVSRLWRLLGHCILMLKLEGLVSQLRRLLDNCWNLIYNSWVHVENRGIKSVSTTFGTKRYYINILEEYVCGDNM